MNFCPYSWLFPKVENKAFATDIGPYNFPKFRLLSSQKQERGGRIVPILNTRVDFRTHHTGFVSSCDYNAA